MKKRGFREYFDRFFNRETFYLLIVPNLVCLLFLYAAGWPPLYTDAGRKKPESQLTFERHNDRLIDEFVRPRIEAKYNVKTLRSKTDGTNDGGVHIRIETDGTGRYEEIAEDALRLLPVNLNRINVAWSRTPDIGDDGEPKDPPPDTEKRQQPKYILEFDHGSDDGGITVFFANGHKYPVWPPWQYSGRTPWHTEDLWAKMNVQ